MKTDEAIQNLADGFCKIGQGEQFRNMYVESLTALVRMAKMEYRIDPDGDADKVAAILKGSK